MAIITIRVPTILFPTVTTTIRLIAIPTMELEVHSNTNRDNVFYEIYSVKVLVLKRFIPSKELIEKSFLVKMDQ